MEVEAITIGKATTAREVYLRQHIESLDCIVGKLSDASNSLHSLADRLLGVQPETDANKDVKACPEGVIGECQDRADLLSNKAEQILFALERLTQIA